MVNSKGIFSCVRIKSERKRELFWRELISDVSLEKVLN